LRSGQALSRAAKLNPYLTLAAVLIAIHGVLLYGFTRIGFGQFAARGDGKEYMTMAEALTKGQLVGSHFPFYPAIIGVASYFMPTDFAALVIPPAFHVLFALTLYKIFQQSKSKHPWLYSLTLALFPPSVLVYSSSALSDAGTVFFIALVFYYGLKAKENLMLVASLFAASSHDYATLLIIPLACWFWKTHPRRLPLALIPVLPFIIFSTAQFFQNGNFFLYVNIAAASTQSWGSALLTYPFGSLVYSATVLSGVDRVYWSGYLSLIYAVYGVGLFLTTKRRSYWRTFFSAPFYLFSVLLAGYYFVPRFLIPSFPSLIEFAEVEKKLKILRWTLVVVIIASTAYAFWFLLIRVPETGFVS